ncbi:DUF3828 domain-containing protein [Pedobacter caeni]|uniref:DUF3828 domain-containing protein n=1 Tax=Pedobacter caeni TaxID=288992 RepID=A0A1M5EZA4_9SPHI|nr:DUF3828 domain-containing protein [Pedobacter caeni]SHF84457.1 Protein of unknown function [Pedobacter caeni]
MKFKILLPALIIATILFSFIPPDTNQITKVLKSFYKSQVDENGHHLNDELLSNELRSLLKSRDSLEKVSAAELKAKNSTDKPESIDGDIFTSNFDGGATSFKIGKITVKDNKANVMIRLTHSYDQMTWNDEVNLVKEEGTWKIDNVHYKGKNPVGTDAKKVLQKFISDH